MAAATSSCVRLNVTLRAAPPTVRFKSGASSSGSFGRGGAGLPNLRLLSDRLLLPSAGAVHVRAAASRHSSASARHHFPKACSRTWVENLTTGGLKADFYAVPNCFDVLGRARLQGPALCSLSGPSLGLLELHSNVREARSVDHNELWTTARRRQAARIYVPGVCGFWRQRQVRERGI